MQLSICVCVYAGGHVCLLVSRCPCVQGYMQVHICVSAYPNIPVYRVYAGIYVCLCVSGCPCVQECIQVYMCVCVCPGVPVCVWGGVQVSM